jgi:RimJ/RimL family protein N-acetyltransferase
VARAAFVKAPASRETPRLVLRRPRPDDAADVFERYAGDPEVTRYLSWPRHRTITATRAFLGFADTEWQVWPAGPYLIHSRETGVLLGSTGLAFETPYRASTGYVLARDAWGHGYATEALHAIVDIASELDLQRLYALCHVDHHASWRVLEKCGFEHEGVLRRYALFPNLDPHEAADVISCSLTFPAKSAGSL